MFGHFLYFIIALLIYTTYQPAVEAPFTPVETLLYVIIVSAFFTMAARFDFYALAKGRWGNDQRLMSARFEGLVRRHSILALVVFAVGLYGLNMTSLLQPVGLVQAVPTVEALIVLGVYVGYMALLWWFAYRPYRIFTHNAASRGRYVAHHIAFNLPVLIPWLALAGLSDLINLLPVEWLRSAMQSTAGQVAYFFVFLFLTALFAPLMMRYFWRCEPLAEGLHRERIEGVCRQAGLKYAEILRWPALGGHIITAGIMGLSSRFRYLLVTDGLLESLEPSEIKAVVAHEIGHVKKWHLAFYLLFLAGYMLIAYAMLDIVIYLLIFSAPFEALVAVTGLSTPQMASILYSMMTVVLFFVYFRYLFGYFMRNFERQADVYVYRLFQSALPLITTLRKIAFSSGQPLDKPNWHHFSIRERIDYLLNCETDRQWIGRQDRKVRGSIAVFVTAMALVGTGGYLLNFSAAGQRISNNFVAHVIERELAQNPHRADLYASLGDIYQHSGKHARAAAAYERSLALEPNQPSVLNNLAWLLVTTTDAGVRDPSRALIMATRAAVLDQSPHILDTLAESLHANGDHHQAAEVSRAALGKARENRSYYEQQLKRFQKAAGQAT
jgi:Zn-dependent protease with chaperone function